MRKNASFAIAATIMGLTMPACRYRSCGLPLSHRSPDELDNRPVTSERSMRATSCLAAISRNT